MTTDNGTRVVRLVAVPVSLVVRTQEHLDELLRELQIITIGARTGPRGAPVPDRLARLVAETLARLETARALTHEQSRAAVDAGGDVVTLELALPEGAAADIGRLADLLDEADELCEQGALLTLASPSDVRAFRREMAERLIRELEG